MMRKLMRAVLTLLIAGCTVIFIFVLPDFFAPESEVGLLGVMFKLVTLLAAWFFVYKTWKIDIKVTGSDV